MALSYEIRFATIKMIPLNLYKYFNSRVEIATPNSKNQPGRAKFLEQQRY